MTNAIDGAFGFCSFDQAGLVNEVSYGLTKREYFAAAAMQGLLAGGEIDLVEWKAVLFADALINQLNKTE